MYVYICPLQFRSVASQESSLRTSHTRAILRVYQYTHIFFHISCLAVRVLCYLDRAASARMSGRDAEEGLLSFLLLRISVIVADEIA